MRYFAEQNRKFIDMGGIKVYHGIFPVVYPTTPGIWGPILRFDNKTMLGGSQEVQNFIGTPLQILRFLISGTAHYYDSTGYAAVLHEGDMLIVNPGNQALQSIIANSDEENENELLEIWITSNSNKKVHHLQSAGETAFNSPFQRTTFAAGTSLDFEGGKSGTSIILSVLHGMVRANGNQLNYGDIAIVPSKEPLRLEFEKPTDLFQVEIQNQSNGEGNEE
jgi:hypothetical protein